MRRMLDALNPNDIPLAAVNPGDLIAGYLGHASNPQSYAQAVARFPGHQIVSIASHNAVDAQILDVENGAVDPSDYATMNAWSARQLARGVFPTFYMNTSTWPGVLPHLTIRPNWWAARWSPDLVLPTAAVGLQYAGQPGYDISELLDYIEGIDTMTAPLTQAQVTAAVSDGTTAALIGTLQTIYGSSSPAAGNLQTINAKLTQIVELLTTIATPPSGGGLHASYPNLTFSGTITPDVTPAS